MASVQIILNKEQTKRLFKILMPSFIEIAKHRKAGRALKGLELTMASDAIETPKNVQ